MPRTIGRYEVKSELGRGGMATVYLAQDPRFGRLVAVKVLPRQFLHDPTFRGRFEREARIIANLEHPAIAPVYDFGEDDGQPFLVMRYMPGGSLMDRMKLGPMPIDEVSKILGRIGSALDYAHRQGIIHRDLKPANILFDRLGNSFLGDFGIVKLQEATVTYTGTNIVGTPSYMSPEQIQGDDTLDGRSDIYSLGVIAFEMLTGLAPYRADTPAKLMMKHVMEPVPIMREVKADLPEACQPVIEQAMAKDRDRRFETASDLADALKKASLAIPSPPATRPLETALGATVIEPVVEDSVPEKLATRAAAPPTKIGTAPSSAAARPPLAEPASRRRRSIPLWGWLAGCLAVVVVVVVVGAGALLVAGAIDLSGATVTLPSTNTPDLAATQQSVANADTATAEAIALLTLDAAERATAEVEATLTGMARATATARAEATQTIAARQTAAVASADSVVEVASTWPILLSDSFDTNAHEWCTGTDSGALLNGEWTIAGGAYLWEVEALDDFVWWCAPEDTELSGDFFVRVEGELLTGPAESTYGIIFRRLDNDNYYLFRIQNNGFYQLLLRTQDSWHVLIEWTATPDIRQDSVNRLAVVGMGTHYTFFVNGRYQGEVDDGSLTSGRTGMASGLFEPGDSAVFVFDNLEIRSP